MQIITYLVLGGIGTYLFIEAAWFCFCITFKAIDNFING